MRPLWTAAEAAAATGGRAHGTFLVDDVAIDSRGPVAGALFVALVGEHRDGHGFVADALAKGAAAALVARVDPSWPPGVPLLEVADTLTGLADLGRAARARSSARVLGVTGSVGKTSTKEALREVLAGQGPTHASAASYNNHWGVPLSLARMPRDTAFGVFELGMNHPGEIRPLASMVRPHVAVVTAIAPAHLELLGSIEAIAAAKAELFEGLEPGGVAILPRDSAQFELLLERAVVSEAAVVTFGADDRADWRLIDAELGADGSTVVARRSGRGYRFTLAAAGRHAVSNALAVLAAVEALGGDPEHAAARLAQVRPPAGRGARRPLEVDGGEALLLDESYNANPASVRAAIEVLGRHEGRRLAVLGDMLELGPDGPALHAGLADALERAAVDLVFTCGPLMRHLFEALPPRRRGAHRPSAAELAPVVAAELRPGDVLLVKGSLGSRMKAVVDAVTDRSPAALARAG